MKFHSCWQVSSTSMICFPLFCSSDFSAIYIFILHCSASNIVVANKHDLNENFHNISAHIKNIIKMIEVYPRCFGILVLKLAPKAAAWREQDLVRECICLFWGNAIKVKMEIKVPDIICRMLTTKEATEKLLLLWVCQ